MKRVTAKLVTRHNDMALVEWIDDMDGSTRRAWVTPDMIVGEEGRLATVEHPDGGIPYGEDWSEFVGGHISAVEVENRLKQSGIWTHEDLQRQPNVALGIFRGLAGDLLQELLHNARAAQKRPASSEVCMAGEQILFARNGALWVQVDGPNTAVEYLGCVDLDAIAEPGGGIDTLLRCFRVDGQGWETIGATLTPPDPVTTTITALAAKTQNALELIKSCAANFFVTQSETGRKDNFDNYVRTWILENGYISDRGASNLTMRETDGESTMTFGLSVFPPLLRIFKKATSRQSVGLGAAANALAYLDDIRCASGSGPAQRAGKIGYISGDLSTGSPGSTADVFYTTNYGTTWTATSTDPFAASEIIASIAVFAQGATGHRVVVARGTTDAGNPAEIAYSDDSGTTWTTVSVGSTNAQFVNGPGGLFALDANDMWMVTTSGYVYKSADGGVTWSTQDAGVATTSNLYAVHFADERVGFAAGASDDVIRTIDGGVSWSAVTDVGSGATLNTIFAINAQRAFVGTANGRMYYTEDAGTTWTRRSFSGDGVGAVKDIVFYSELVGYMVHDTASPVGRIFQTRDGGYSWELITTTTNSGLNDLAVLDENNAFVAGEVNNGTAALIKVLPAA